MENYLKNTIIKYQKRTVTSAIISEATDNFSVPDYFTLNWVKIDEYIKSLDDSFFDWFQMEDDDKLERVALEIYGVADYWDIILIVNHRNPLMEFPHNYDALVEFTERKIQKYIDDVYGKELAETTYQLMYNKYLEELNNNINTWRTLTIIKPSKIQEFLTGGYELGIF